jgi:hypothetical protein
MGEGFIWVVFTHLGASQRLKWPMQKKEHVPKSIIQSLDIHKYNKINKLWQVQNFKLICIIF